MGMAQEKYRLGLQYIKLQILVFAGFESEILKRRIEVLSLISYSDVLALRGLRRSGYEISVKPLRDWTEW